MGGIIFMLVSLMLLTCIAIIYDFIINGEIKIINENHVIRRSRTFTKFMIFIDLIFLILFLIFIIYIVSEF